MRQQTGSRNRGWLPTIGNRLSVAAGVALAAGMMVAFAPRAQAQVQASGGNVTNNYWENGTNFIAQVFTNSGTLTVNGSGGNVEYLLVAGGGGGGGAWQGGGGGAGGFLTGPTNLTAGAYTVTVGTNGIGGYSTANTLNGGDSSLTNSSLAIVAYGGGAGGGEGYAGKSGGSGGGGANGQSAGGGSNGPPIQGYSGGSAAYQSGSGGGGAAGLGTNAPSNSVGGGGGPGRSSTMRNGVAVTYATGGYGSNGRTAASGPHRDPNTGHGGYGGGGASPTASGNNGGSGIVIVRYDSGAALIRNVPASNTATNAATLNGWLVSTGFFDTAVSVLYGTNNGAVSGAWAITNWWNTGDWGNNSFPFTNVVGLIQDRTYYYTFAASNAVGDAAALLPTNFMSFITGEVRVDTTGDNAQFTGSNGQFTISRPATCASEPLTVYYAMSASASNGVDYMGMDGLALPGSVVISAGATSATVNFRVKADGDTANEDAVLTLLSGYSYPVVVGAGSDATVTILPGTPGGGLVTTGGTMTRYRENGTNFIARIFTNSGVLAVSSNGADTAVDYLIIAGGGGGGGSWESGGGGAGGIRIGNATLSAGEYTITVGAGGLGYGQGTPNDGTNGYPSSITNASGPVASATGGGRGGSSFPAGTGTSALGGGSGGGSYTTQTPGSKVGGGELGNDGATASGNNGGGGGGAGSAGQGVSPYAGGNGTNLAFSGIPVSYAKGGAGGSRAANGGRVHGADAAANTGNGGTGGVGTSEAAALGISKGGSGGSGIVIVRYVDSGTFDATVTVTSATAQWPFQVGAFTITRPDDANTNYSASVSYTMTGTAANGVDYSANLVTNSPTGYPTPAPQALSGYATFAPGVTSVVVNVYPLHNPPFSAKTATMTLNVVGSPTADVTFPAWAGTRVAATATGGTLTNYPYGGGTNWEAYVFTNTAVNGTLTVSAGGTVEYLVVAGGGGAGGGWNGGGGGAGGLRFGSMTLPTGTYTIVVGAGGKGCVAPTGGTSASNGYPSVISTVGGIGVIGTAGGGRGGSEAQWGANDGGTGGSGGGARATATWPAIGHGLAVTGEGNIGGPCLNQNYGGGGGGFSSTGGVGTASTHGLGGDGTNLNFTGVLVEYAKGGRGGNRATNLLGTNGTANTGMGGLGAGGGVAATYNGGNGGSGIVVVRYLVPPPPKGTLIMMR
jgi:hypothetical protein